VLGSVSITIPLVSIFSADFAIFSLLSISGAYYCLADGGYVFGSPSFLLCAAIHSLKQTIAFDEMLSFFHSWQPSCEIS
jgi:hypothetical protein